MQPPEMGQRSALSRSGTASKRASTPLRHGLVPNKQRLLLQLLSLLVLASHGLIIRIALVPVAASPATVQHASGKRAQATVAGIRMMETTMSNTQHGDDFFNRVLSTLLPQNPSGEQDLLHTPEHRAS